MTRIAARLTIHFGERARSGGVPLAERIMSALDEGDLASAVLLRGGEGFGPGHGLRTSGQLSLSEDLPLVAIALDSGERIHAVAAQVRAMFHEGLVTVEPVQVATGAAADYPKAESSRLTVWTARHARIEGLPVHSRLVDWFRDHGLKAAVVLPGVDGLTDGVRRRAGFFSANRSVPTLVTGVGSGRAVASVRDTVSSLLPGALVETMECSSALPVSALEGRHPRLWRISVFGDGTEPETGIHRQREIVRTLRAGGASGATAYFGHYGFVGGESPHGDSMLSLRRRVPVLTEVVDSPANCERWLRAIEEMDDGSLVKTLSPVELISRPAGPA